MEDGKFELFRSEYRRQMCEKTLKEIQAQLNAMKEFQKLTPRQIEHLRDDLKLIEHYKGSQMSTWDRIVEKLK